MTEQEERRFFGKENKSGNYRRKTDIKPIIVIEYKSSIYISLIPVLLILIKYFN